MSSEDVRREFEGQLARRRNGGFPERDFPTLPDQCWTGIYRSYLDCVRPTTEADDIYHYVTMEMALGMVAGYKPYFHYVGPLRLNTFAVVIGPSADAHKGVPLNYLLRLLSGVGLLFEYCSNTASIEGAKEQVESSGQRTILFHEPEIAVLTANAGRVGTRNLLPGLCHVYDCPEEWRMTKKGSKPIERPYAHLFGASTPDWADKLESLDALSGGFLNRNIIVYGDPTRIIALPPKPDPRKWGEIIEELRSAREWCENSADEITFSPAGKERYVEWIERWKTERRERPATEREVTARTDVHAIKGACKRAICRRSLTIEPDDLEPAIAAAEVFERTRALLFHRAGLSPIGKLELLIRERHPGGTIRFSKLHELVGGRHSAKDVLDACRTLAAVGELILDEEAYGRGNKRMTVMKL